MCESSACSAGTSALVARQPMRDMQLGLSRSGEDFGLITRNLGSVLSSVGSL